MELPAAISLTGTFPTIKLPEWITGSSSVETRLNGSVSSACAWTTDVTSGRATKNRRIDGALQIGLALVLDGLALLIELD